jgi:hypothetical protein
MARPAAAGKQVPFRGSLEGQEQVLAPPPLVVLLGEGGGTATHLGRFVYDLEATVDFRELPPQGAGVLTFTAANGDVLVAEIEGISTPIIPGLLILIEEEATVTRGTGRFAGASGGFSITRFKNQVTGLTVGRFDGTISSPGANK